MEHMDVLAAVSAVYAIAAMYGSGYILYCVAEYADSEE